VYSFFDWHMSNNQHMLYQSWTLQHRNYNNYKFQKSETKEKDGSGFVLIQHTECPTKQNPPTPLFFNIRRDIPPCTASIKHIPKSIIVQWKNTEMLRKTIIRIIMNKECFPSTEPKEFISSSGFVLTFFKQVSFLAYVCLVARKI
jgi:hypothetical protein